MGGSKMAGENAFKRAYKEWDLEEISKAGPEPLILTHDMTNSLIR